MNKTYYNDFKDFFKYTKEIKELPPLSKKIDTKYLRDFINEFESVQQENARLKEIENKLIFIKNRVKQGMSQENINKCAIELVNSYLKEN